MLSTAKDGLAQLLVLYCEWVVDNADSASILDSKTNKHCDCRQVALHKVISAVERVNPNAGIARIESLEILDLHVIFVIVGSESIADPIATILLA